MHVLKQTLLRGLMMKQVTPQALPAPLMQFDNPTTSTDLCANSDKM